MVESTRKIATLLRYTACAADCVGVPVAVLVRLTSESGTTDNCARAS